MITGVALASGIDLGKVDLPLRDWNQTAEPSRTLVKRIILLQQFLGFLIPIMLYVLVYRLSYNSVVAFFGSLVYFWDISSVCYQFALLTETLSIWTLVGVFLLLFESLRSPGYRRFLLLGLALGWAAVLRPSFFLLVPLILATFSIRAALARVNIAKHLVLFSIVASIFPLLWAASNRIHYGHWFFTKNQTVTLQNFSARHFVDMDVEGEDLNVLQGNTREALEKGPNYAYSRSLVKTANDLGGRDFYQMYRLMDRANGMAVRANLRAFLSGGWSRFRSVWTDGFADVKNSYVQRRLSHLFGRDVEVFQNSRLLFGGASFWVFVFLTVGCLAIERKSEVRTIILFSFVFVMTYGFLTCLFDEMEWIRHSMAIRILVNSFMVLEIGLLVAWTLSRWNPRMISAIARLRGRITGGYS